MSERTTAYRCDDLEFRVSFLGDTATVVVGEDTLRLPIAVSASGARYSDGRHTFWEHQGNALLELPDTSYTSCRRIQGDRR